MLFDTLLLDSIHFETLFLNSKLFKLGFQKPDTSLKFFLRIGYALKSPDTWTKIFRKMTSAVRSSSVAVHQRLRYLRLRSQTPELLALGSQSSRYVGSSVRRFVGSPDRFVVLRPWSSSYSYCIAAAKTMLRPSLMRWS